MKIVKKVGPAFDEFIFDWDYETYLLVGGYGSGKSYHVALKIILKLLEEKRKVLVVREVFETISDSCFDLFAEILDSMDLYTDDPREFRRKPNKVLATRSPLKFRFPNGSSIIFKGMDKPAKVKSITGVSIVWLEEASEVKYDGYLELLGRLRTPDVSMHFILSTNPISRENWIYRHFFKRLNDDGSEETIVDEEQLYNEHCLVHNGIYYHHSTPSDNPWLPWQYMKRLDDMRRYDYPLYMVARFGRFGAAGKRVLPQLRVANRMNDFWNAIDRLGAENQYFGFDFGFEESYNAVVSMSVDEERRILYVWDEIYLNHVTDPDFAVLPEMVELKEKLDGYAAARINKAIVADNEDPKAIAYYRQCGYRIRPCSNKFHGSRLSNTRKIKRFTRILVHPKCKNTIRELRDLTYKKDSKGNVIYDEFNIDPHTFSAIWYALDKVTVANPKDKVFHSKKG